MFGIPWQFVIVRRSLPPFPVYLPTHADLFLFDRNYGFHRQEYESILAEGRRHVLLDVRVEVQFAVCALDNAVNVPLSRLEVRNVNVYANGKAHC